MKGFENLWIKLQDQILLLGNLHVPIRDCVAYPFSKRSAYDCIGYVHDPLARYLVHVSVIRQILQHPIVLTGLLEDVMYGKALVLRTRQELHLVAREEELLLHAKI